LFINFCLLSLVLIIEYPLSFPPLIISAYHTLEDLNPYVKQVSAMEYECGRHGGTSPVADFACQECGKDGVSITEDLLPIGKCCYCGYENEHYVCELCGTVYDDMGGDEHLCNGCMPRDD
jgi:rubredoxin